MHFYIYESEHFTFIACHCDKDPNFCNGPRSDCFCECGSSEPKCKCHWKYFGDQCGDEGNTFTDYIHVA